MLVSSGRRLDMSTPFVDALLPDGSRLHVVIPSITRQHWAINIRKFVARAFDLSGLVALGSLTPQAAAFLEDRKSTRLNSSHVAISYAVFCLKKKNTRKRNQLCIRTRTH